MKTLPYIFTVIFALSGTAVTKAQLNEYKYFLVPKKLECFKNENQHQTSTLLKFLFEEEGFDVYYTDDPPAEYLSDECLGLRVELQNDSKMFSTRVAIILKDCYQKTVFSSVEGRSREKDYKKGYREAIKQAFATFEGMDHEYNPSEKDSSAVTVNFADDVKEVAPEATAAATAATSAAITQTASPEEQQFKDQTPKPSEYTKAAAPTAVVAETSGEDDAVLKAKELENGYELRDTNQDLKLTLFKTSNKDVYLARQKDVDGMVYKREGKWFFEYYNGEELVVEELKIAF